MAFVTASLKSIDAAEDCRRCVMASSRSGVQHLGLRPSRGDGFDQRRSTSEPCYVLLERGERIGVFASPILTRNRITLPTGPDTSSLKLRSRPAPSTPVSAAYCSGDLPTQGLPASVAYLR